MNGTIALLKKELLEQWRTNKILILVLGFLFSGLQGPVITKLLPELIKNSSSSLQGIQITIPEQTALDAILSYVSQMSAFPALILILVVMGPLAGERERGTQVFVLTKPVTRSQFILAKYFTYLGILVGAVILTAIASTYYTLLLFSNSFDFGPFVVLNLGVISYISYILALVVLCSSLFKTPVAAGGVSFVAFLVIDNLVKFIPNWTKFFPQAIFDPGNARKVMTGATGAGDLLIPVIMGLVMAAVLLGIACFNYEKREM
jgi:ABC-2 type transport system permease protein